MRFEFVCAGTDSLVANNRALVPSHHHHSRVGYVPFLFFTFLLKKKRKFLERRSITGRIQVDLAIDRSIDRRAPPSLYLCLPNASPSFVIDSREHASAPETDTLHPHNDDENETLCFHHHHHVTYTAKPTFMQWAAASPASAASGTRELHWTPSMWTCGISTCSGRLARRVVVV
jgi:hypothetical protein